MALERGAVAADDSLRVLPVNRRSAEAALLAFQIPLWSVIGAVAWETGGIVVDHGWLRLLGGGGPRMAADLGSYNGVGPQALLGTTSGMYTVAVDAVGGGFIINQGRMPGATGRIWYLAPDTLEWTPLEMGYTGFLDWALTRPRSYARLYEPLRWPRWRTRIEKLPLDEGVDQARTIWSSAATSRAPDAEREGPRQAPLVELWQRTLSHRTMFFDEEGAAAAGMSGVQEARRRRKSRWQRTMDVLRRIK